MIRHVLEHAAWELGQITVLVFHVLQEAVRKGIIVVCALCQWIPIVFPVFKTSQLPTVLFGIARLQNGFLETVLSAVLLVIGTTTGQILRFYAGYATP